MTKWKKTKRTGLAYQWIWLTVSHIDESRYATFGHLGFYSIRMLYALWAGLNTCKDSRWDLTDPPIFLLASHSFSHLTSFFYFMADKSLEQHLRLIRLEFLFPTLCCLSFSSYLSTHTRWLTHTSSLLWIMDLSKSVHILRGVLQHLSSVRSILMWRIIDRS